MQKSDDLAPRSHETKSVSLKKQDKKNVRDEAAKLTRESFFVEELLLKYKPCANRRCHGGTCYVCPKTARHIPLTHQQLTMWAKEHVSFYFISFLGTGNIYE